MEITKTRLVGWLSVTHGQYFIILPENNNSLDYNPMDSDQIY